MCLLRFLCSDVHITRANRTLVFIIKTVRKKKKLKKSDIPYWLEVFFVVFWYNPYIRVGLPVVTRVHWNAMLSNVCTISQIQGDWLTLYTHSTLLLCTKTSFIQSLPSVALFRLTKHCWPYETDARTHIVTEQICRYRCVLVVCVLLYWL